MAKRPNEVGGILESLDKYPEHLRLIGLIITETARAEGTLALTLWALLGDPKRADAVFWTLGNAKARADVVRGAAMQTLVGSKTDELLLTDVLDAVGQFRAAASKRNDIAHAEWGTPAKGCNDPFVSIKRPATKNPVFERIYTTNDLQKIVDEIRAAEKQLGLVNQALEYFKGNKVIRSHWNERRQEFDHIDAFFRKYELP